MKRHAEKICFFTFVLHFFFGLSHTGVHLSVFIHFKQSVSQRPVCIGPFISTNICDLNKSGIGMETVDCFKCYQDGCHTNNFEDITTTNLTVGKNGKQNVEKLLKSNRTLFVDLEIKCPRRSTSLKRFLLDLCKNNTKLQCPDPFPTETTFTKPVVTKEPITSFSSFTSSTFPPTTHLTSTTLSNWENNNSNTNPSEKSNTVLWISLGAIAFVFIFVACIILIFQRAKITEFLWKSENPDVRDDAFLYRDMSTRRRGNQPAPDILTYDISHLCLHEIIYTELDLSVQHNLNTENAAASNSTTLELKRDIKSYVDSVIYADIRKD